MPYCSNCGKEVAHGLKFCPNCGAPQGTATSFTPDSSAGRPPSPPRPAPAGLFIILYLILGILLIFLGGYTLLFSSLFNLDALVLAMLIFLGDGVLALLTVYGFLRRGKWAWRYITLAGICCIIGGAFLSISAAIGLVALGGFAAALGAGTLVYLRLGSAKAYLSR